jgi:hypothetical protein
MRRLRSTFSLIAIAIIPAFQYIAADQVVGDDKVETIAELIDKLDADRFITRELATEQLMASGQAAIAPLAEKLKIANRETLSRGTYILRELAMSSDPDVSSQAESGLKTVADSDHVRASRQAKATLHRLSEIRRDRALVALRQLGAVIGTQHIQLGQAIIPNLSTLELNEKWKGTSDDLRQLRWLPDVQHVTLKGEKIDDDCVSHLKHLKSLTIVQLKKAKITDRALEHLAGQKNLQHLAILYCPISNRSIDDLKVHQKVTLLKLYGTALTAMGAERLQEEMKATKVDFRQGAFLGIACDPNAAQCIITYCQPGGAAEKGGLQGGDLILKYNGKPAGDFATLTKLIGENKPGQKASIELMRGGETLTKEVELGEWE